MGGTCCNEKRGGGGKAVLSLGGSVPCGHRLPVTECNVLLWGLSPPHGIIKFLKGQKQLNIHFFTSIPNTTQTPNQSIRLSQLIEAIGESRTVMNKVRGAKRRCSLCLRND